MQKSVLVLLVVMVSGEWVEIHQSDQLSTASRSKEKKVESDVIHPNEERSCSGGQPNDCAPDIHSWTAWTWGESSNASEEASASNELGLDKSDVQTSAPRSPEGKMMMLQALQDRIMNNIETRIFALGDREARGQKGMGSMEGALITISLLTFAVYLIKIVMMLINSLHSKKAMMQMGPTVTPGFQTYVLNHGRRRRSISAQRRLQQVLKFTETLNN